MAIMVPLGMELLLHTQGNIKGRTLFHAIYFEPI